VVGELGGAVGRADAGGVEQILDRQRRAVADRVQLGYEDVVVQSVP
jgi:hypothetical protein